MENRIIEFDFYYMYFNENMVWFQNDKFILFLYIECVWYLFIVMYNEQVCRYLLIFVY